MLDLAHFCERRIEIRAAARDEGDARAFLGKRVRTGEADALACTGDDDDSIVQSEIHVRREGPPRPTDPPPGGQRAERAWGEASSSSLQ